MVLQVLEKLFKSFFYQIDFQVLFKNNVFFYFKLYSKKVFDFDSHNNLVFT